MITKTLLESMFTYVPETGEFIRKTNIGRAKAGDLAGGIDSLGYRRISVKGVRYYAHHLVWVMERGRSPDNTIDHINGDKADNRITNLRDVPHQINAQNQVRPRKDNTSGHLGVCISGGKFIAQIQVTVEGRRRNHLKAFADIDSAIRWRTEKKMEIHGAA